MQIKFNGTKENKLFKAYQKLDKLKLTDVQIRVVLKIHKGTLDRLRQLENQIKQNLLDAKYGEPNKDSQFSKANTVVELPKQSQDFTFHSNTILDYIFKN